MASGDLVTAFKKGKVNAYLELGYSEIVALSAFRTPQHRDGVRKVFAAPGRQDPAIRGRRLSN